MRAMCNEDETDKRWKRPRDAGIDTEEMRDWETRDWRLEMAEWS